MSLDLQNGDTVIVVARENDGAPFFTKSVRGYRLGWNLVRTITYVGYKKRGSSQTGTSPAYNFVTKCFRRGSTFQNTFGSVGYGVTTFPLGVTQNGSDSAQTALGLTLSLLDDWVQVGYARNLSSSKNFLFVGAQIPLRLGK